MAERNSGDDQDRRPGDDQEDGPGENQEQENAGEEPAQASSSWERPSSSWERPGARPGNTPARQPLTEYKKWYNRNRPGKKERQEGAKARGIPPPPGVFKGCDAKGKDSKGKEKGKEKGKDKGKQGKAEQGKGKGQPGRVGGRTPPHPHHAKDLPQVWWNQATARLLRMSRNIRATVRKRKVPRQRQGSSWCPTLPL